MARKKNSGNLWEAREKIVEQEQEIASLRENIAHLEGIDVGELPQIEYIQQSGNYIFDDREVELRKLRNAVNALTRYNAINRRRLEAIINLMASGDLVDKEQIEAALNAEDILPPKNISDFMGKRVQKVVEQYQFKIIRESHGKYRLVHLPKNKAIIFFTTQPGENKLLVDLLLRLQESPDKVKGWWDTRARLVECGCVIGDGDADVFASIEGQTINDILHVIDTLSRRHKSVRKKIRSSKTYIVTPSTHWQLRQEA